MTVADVIARRSACVRRQAGTVIVSKDQKIVGTGYNGPPAKYPRPVSQLCDAWCPRATSGGTTNQYDDCPSVHSEPNALLYSDRKDREGGTAYVTSCPCLTCAKELANSGLTRVVLRIGPADAVRDPETTIAFLKRSGLTVEVLS